MDIDLPRTGVNGKPWYIDKRLHDCWWQHIHIAKAITKCYAIPTVTDTVIGLGANVGLLLIKLMKPGAGD